MSTSLCTSKAAAPCASTLAERNLDGLPQRRRLESERDGRVVLWLRCPVEFVDPGSGRAIRCEEISRGVFVDIAMQWLHDRASVLVIIGIIAAMASLLDAKITRTDGWINERLDRLTKANGT